MRITKDQYGYDVQVFTPAIGVQLPTSYTPTANEVVILGSDVTITLDSIAIDYTAGNVIGLSSGIVYTLSAATNVHKM